MKRWLLIATFSVSILCLLGLSVSKALLLNNSQELTLSAPDKVIAMENNKTKMIKTETKDYYYYEIKDYERDLEYSWKFLKNKDDNIAVEDSLYIEEDLRLSLDANTNNTAKINEEVKNDKLIITFDYHGDLPLETTVRLNVQNRFKNGEKLYIYYYNPELDQIEYVDHGIEVKNGYVEFQIDHCSDYFLTAAVVNDAVNNPQSINLIIIGLVIVVFILIAITLFQAKK